MADSRNYPVLPLDDAVVLPGMVIPIELRTTDVQAAVDAAQLAETPVLLVPRLAGRYAGIGTVATVEQIGRLPGGQAGAVLRGTHRASIGTGTTGPGAALWVEAADVPVADSYDEEVLGLAREYKGLATSILHQRGASQLVDSIARISDPSLLADTAGYAPYVSTEQKLAVLRAVDVRERLTLVVRLAREHLAELDVAETIRKDVQEGMDRQQREFLLRKQLSAVQKELRELSGGSSDESEEQDLRSRVAAADLPEAARKAALKELDKLERTSDQSPESGWIHTWLDTLLELPWGVRTQDSYDIAGARQVLDADHAGLDDVKERITEFLAVRRRREQRGLGVVGGRRSGAVLALVGPPGVGKTSLGESVARAMGRNFVRVALGGVRDEAEIRGHRRTYVGAMPGRIVRALKEAGSMNPVVLLDEVDKVGADYRGDPTAALLEVLDPAQNHTFRDHYLEVELDLSDVVFLATANVLESIPGPLLDRMELVRLDGYTEDEKVTIARDHLLPRQLSLAGLTSDEVLVEDDALHELAATYTREAGVRELERLLARVMRKVTARLGDAPDQQVVAAATLRDFVGRPRFLPESAERTALPGVAHGARRDRCRRRGAVRRGLAVRPRDRRDGRDPDRPAGGGHEGVGAARAVVPALARCRAEPSGRRPQGPRHPPARSRRSRTQGRPFRRCHHDDSDRLAAVRAARACRRRHDRRGVPDRAGPAHWRREAEAAGRAPGRNPNRPDPGAQRAGPGRRAQERAQRADGPPGVRRPAGARTGAGAAGGGRPRRVRLGRAPAASAACANPDTAPQPGASC